MEATRTLYHTRPFAEPRPEDSVCVLEHAVLQADNDKLTALEPRLDKPPNILGMRDIEGRVNLVQDVHRCWLVRCQYLFTGGR